MKPTSSVHSYRWRLVERSLTPMFHARIQESRPETFQPANGSFLEFRKKIFPATQKLAVERELANSNTHPACSLEDRNRANCFAVSLTGGEQAWIGKSGQAIFDPGIFTLGHPDKSRLGECLIGLF